MGRLSLEKRLKRAKALRRELDGLRDMANAILANGAYSRKAWLDQKARIRHSHPSIKDEEKIVDGIWAQRHRKAEQLAVLAEELLTAEDKERRAQEVRELGRCKVCGKFRGIYPHEHEGGSDFKNRLLTESSNTNAEIVENMEARL